MKSVASTDPGARGADGGERRREGVAVGVPPSVSAAPLPDGKGGGRDASTDASVRASSSGPASTTARTSAASSTSPSLAAHAPAARHACIAGLAELPDLPSAIACARTADLINAHTVLVGFGLNPLRDPGGDATHAPRADALATAVAPPTQLSAIDDKISTASAPRPPAWAARSARSCHAGSELADRFAVAFGFRFGGSRMMAEIDPGGAAVG